MVIVRGQKSEVRWRMTEDRRPPPAAGAYAPVGGLSIVQGNWELELKGLGLASDSQFSWIDSPVEMSPVPGEDRFRGFHPGQGGDIGFRPVDVVKIFELLQFGQKLEPARAHPVVPVL